MKPAVKISQTTKPPSALFEKVLCAAVSGLCSQFEKRDKDGNLKHLYSHSEELYEKQSQAWTTGDATSDEIDRQIHDEEFDFRTRWVAETAVAVAQCVMEELRLSDFNTKVGAE